MLKEQVLAPLIVVALAVSVGTIAWAAKRHRKSGPLVLTLFGSGGIVVGRLIWDIPLLVYVCSAGLLLASFWNLWLKRRRSEPLVGIRLSGS
jgi:hypothetical protein